MKIRTLDVRGADFIREICKMRTSLIIFLAVSAQFSKFVSDDFRHYYSEIKWDFLSGMKDSMKKILNNHFLISKRLINRPQLLKDIIFFDNVKGDPKDNTVRKLIALEEPLKFVMLIQLLEIFKETTTVK